MSQERLTTACRHIACLADPQRSAEATRALAVMASASPPGEFRELLDGAVHWASHLRAPLGLVGMQQLSGMLRRLEQMTPAPYAPPDFIAAGGEGSPPGRRSTRFHALLNGTISLGSPTASPPLDAPPCR